MIIKFCSAQFCDCLKYHELADRLGERIPAAASTPAAWAGPAARGEATITVPLASGEQGDLLVPRWADPAALLAAFDRIRGRR